MDIIRVPPVHVIGANERAEYLEKMSEADVIVLQPTSNSFGELSSESVRAELSHKEIVSFPSIYFAGTMPQLRYLRLPAGGTLQGPLGDYHDDRIVSGYLTDKDPREVATWLDDKEVSAAEHFEACVRTSQEREKKADIQILDAILDRIQIHQTMYTFNHPDNTIINVAVERVLKILGRPIDGRAQPPVNPMLGSVVSALPDAVLSTLGFNYRSPHYIKDGEVLAWEDLAQDFFEVYRAQDNFAELVATNNTRNA